jgi:phosphate-selective porin OprO/OprP
MKIGTLMASVAVIAMAAASAQAAETRNESKDSNVERPNLVVAQLNTPSGGGISNAELAARLQALEDAQSSAVERASADRTRLSTLEQSYNSAVWAFDNGRATFASGDGRFSLAIRGRFQFDYAGFSQDSTHPAGFAGPTDLSSGAVVRRAYFGIEGKAYSDFSYELRFNAGGSDGGSFGAGGVPAGGEGDPLLNKAVISYTGIPNWHLNVGILEPVLMMEGTTSSANLMFMERPDFENIAADTFGAGDSRRGIEIGWAKTDAFWAGDNVTVTAAFTGGKTGSAANHGSASGLAVPGSGDENSQVLGRVSDRLYSDGISNISLGGSFGHVLNSGSNGNPNGGSQTINLRDRPEIRVDGTRLIGTGGIAAKTADMWAVDLQGNFENFYLGGEYAQFTLDRQCGAVGAAAGCTTATTVADHPTFWGWAIEGSWILTGETKSYTPSALNNEVGGFQGPIPSRPFSMSGGSWGAWELVARYTDTNLNWNPGQTAIAGTQLAGVLGGEERIVSLGVNWYLNRNIRIMLDDNIVSVSKGTALLPDRDSQDFNVIGLRFQYAN